MMLLNSGLSNCSRGTYHQRYYRFNPSDIRRIFVDEKEESNRAERFGSMSGYVRRLMNEKS